MTAFRAAVALVLSLVVLALCGCATTKPETQTVLVPCGAKVSDAPVYPFAGLDPASDLHVKVKTLLGERSMRIARELELTAALTACR